MGYYKDAIKGFSWIGALRVSTRAMAYVKIAVLARLLSPTQFGIFGIASLVLGLLEILTETGINIFLIQEEAEIKHYLNTAYIVSIIRGVFIALVLLILSPFIASFFRSPDAHQILLLTCLIPFIRGFINPAVVKFQKELLFKKDFLFRFSVYSFDAAAAVITAFITHSAMSLVIGLIAGAILEMTLSFLLLKPWPKLSLDREQLRKIIGRGKWITAAGTFNYLFEQGDNIVVGRLMDTTALGFYQMAYRICTLPLTEIADVVKKVTFPIYVKIGADLGRLKKAFSKALIGVIFMVLPFGLIFLFFTKEFVSIFLGNNWLAIVSVLKILSFFGVMRAIIVSTHPVFLAQKKQEYITVITLVGILGLGATIVPLVYLYGIIGAAISASIGAILSFPVAFYLLDKTLKG